MTNKKQNMELKDFIKETLVQITNGVVEAQDLIKDTGCYINPEGRYKDEIVETGYGGEYRSIQKVKMSIAINVIENQKTKAGLGVVSAILTAGASTTNSDSNSVTNRIEFEIPISLPITNVTK
jgi:hypothetical protein